MVGAGWEITIMINGMGSLLGVKPIILIKKKNTHYWITFDCYFCYVRYIIFSHCPEMLFATEKPLEKTMDHLKGLIVLSVVKNTAFLQLP